MVALLLIVTYRSPILWLVPLTVIALADRAATSLGGVVSDLTGLTADGSTTGITSVLVEPGPGLFGPLLREGLVDAVWWFTAPVLVGGDGVPAVPALELDAMDQALRLHASRFVIGDDALFVGSLDKRSW